MTLTAASDRLLNLSAILRIATLLWCMLPAALGAQETPDPDLVNHALANELKALQEGGHPMQYRLRKSTPRLTSTRIIIETRDGAVARLLSINDKEPSPAERQKDEARLDDLLADPSRQRKRKLSQQDDTGRVLKVLRALPRAFVFEYAGSETKGSITVAHYAFSPNPRFSSADLELLVLTAMTGTLTIDTTHQRVVRLEGHLLQDVDIGWGILGRLDKGGWITIDQAEVDGGIWRLTRFQMVMSGRVFFKTRSFETIEEESRFAPVPVDLTYQRAIQMLRSGAINPVVGGR